MNHYRIIVGRRQKTEIMARAHALAADSLERSHIWLGVPVVVLTTIVGTTAFTTLNELGSTRIFIAIGTGVFSVVAAVLAALQTFFAFNIRGQRHTDATSQLTALDRWLERLLLNKDEAGVDAELSIIDEELAKVIQQAPRISIELQKRAAADLERERIERRTIKKNLAKESEKISMEDVYIP